MPSEKIVNLRSILLDGIHVRNDRNPYQSWNHQSTLRFFLTRFFRNAF